VGVEDAPEEGQVPGLADSDGAQEESRSQNEGHEKTDDICRSFFVESRVSPKTAENDKEIAGPSGHGYDLVYMLKMSPGDRCMQPMQAITKESRDEKIDVVPQPSCGETDEVAPAIAAKREDDGCKVHPRLEEMKPADVRFEIGGKPEYEDKDGAAGEDEDLRAANGARRGFHDERYDGLIGEVPWSFTEAETLAVRPCASLPA